MTDVRQEPGRTGPRQEPGPTDVRQEPGTTDARKEPQEPHMTTANQLVHRRASTCATATVSSSAGSI